MKVSIVIPAFNEEKYIERCLNSVINQEVNADEIIVIDNNSTDKTAEIATTLGATVVSEKVQGMISARNRGFNEAKYEIIARCDSDTLVPHDWIKTIKNDFDKGGIDGLSGPIYFYDSILLKYLKTLPAKIAMTVMKTLSKGNSQLFGPNMIISKKIWEKVKDIVTLDDTKVHEDMDISLKILKVKGIISYDPGLIVGISARRIIHNPLSFFVEYPTRAIKTFRLDRL